MEAACSLATIYDSQHASNGNGNKHAVAQEKDRLPASLPGVRETEKPQSALDRSVDSFMSLDSLSKKKQALRKSQQRQSFQNWSVFRLKVYTVVRSPIFENLMTCVIFFNILVLIKETDETADDGAVASPWIFMTNKCLLGVYSVELLSKMFALRLSFFLDGWNVMDFMVVSSDILFMLIDTYVGEMPTMSILRIFRLVKLARAIRALNMFPELSMLLRGFMAAFRAIFWGLLLVVMVLMIWSILAVRILHKPNTRVTQRMLYEDCERCPRAFGSVWQSFLTFFQTVVAGDAWGTVALPVIEESPITIVMFICVLVSVSLALMNLILAVIVDSAQHAREDMGESGEEEEEEIEDENGDIIIVTKPPKFSLCEVCSTKLEAEHLFCHKCGRRRPPKKKGAGKDQETSHTLDAAGSDECTPRSEDAAQRQAQLPRLQLRPSVKHGDNSLSAASSLPTGLAFEDALVQHLDQVLSKILADHSAAVAAMCGDKAAGVQKETPVSRTAIAAESNGVVGVAVAAAGKLPGGGRGNGHNSDDSEDEALEPAAAPWSQTIKFPAQEPEAPTRNQSKQSLQPSQNGVDQRSSSKSSKDPEGAREAAAETSSRRSGKSQDMKDTVSAATMARGRSNSNSSGYHALFKRKINSTSFDMLIGGFIVLNTVVMAVQLEYNGAVFHTEVMRACLDCKARVPMMENAFYLFEHCFTLVFTLELGLRLVADGYQYLCAFSNMLDGLIVVVSCADAWYFGPNGNAAMGNVAILRLMRLIRLAKVLRVVRVMKAFTSLRVLVGAVANSVGALGWSMTLLFVLELIGAIFMAQVLRPYLEDPGIEPDLREFIFSRFGTWTNAIFTMFEVTMSPGGFVQYRRLYDEVHSLFGFFFVIYVCIVTFAVVRVITAMFLRTTLAAAAADEQQLALAKAEEQADYIFNLRHMLTFDDYGQLDRDGMDDLLVQGHFINWMHGCGLNASIVDRMFFAHDTNADGSVPFEEFSQALLDSTKPPRLNDSIMSFHETRSILHRLHNLELRLQGKKRATHDGPMPSWLLAQTNRSIGGGAAASRREEGQDKVATAGGGRSLDGGVALAKPERAGGVSALHHHQPLTPSSRSGHAHPKSDSISPSSPVGMREKEKPERERTSQLITMAAL
eukprot:TRINITY_DN30778_c0_g1_i2.p1 TRINITY_DN30778_c0_g1~~TRINITY_DN30778_c0_g1_i2.p1  ORF type:complete len:1138 (+),score=259.71 TRINITY_DN30778_c0_g1_i2:168-3581(+)